jgi:hypothetical protein
LDINNKLVAKDDKKHTICAAFGCNKLATIEIPLKIQNKSIMILVCERCKSKFE